MEYCNSQKSVMGSGKFKENGPGDKRSEGPIFSEKWKGSLINTGYV